MRSIRAAGSKIRSIEDLGRTFGVRSGSSEDISQALLKKTNYDVGLQIRRSQETHRVSENWQIEVSNEGQKLRVRMRQDGRGPWLTKPDEVPAEILSFVRADHRSRDEILSTRSWGQWVRGRWADASYRRHRSKTMTLSFSMDFMEIERGTGHETCEVILTAFSVDCPGEVAPRSLEMPFRLGDLLRACDEIRLGTAFYFSAAA